MEAFAVLTLAAAGCCLAAIGLRSGRRPRFAESLDQGSKQLAVMALLLFGVGMTTLLVGIYVGRITFP